MSYKFTRSSGRALAGPAKGASRAKPGWLPSPDFLRSPVVEFDDPPVLPSWLEIIDSPETSETDIFTRIGERRGAEVQAFYRKYIGDEPETGQIIWSIRRQQVEDLEAGRQAIGILQKVNNSRWVNKYFRAVNARLAPGGTFVGCVEVNSQRKRRFLQKYPAPFGRPLYYLDCLAHRIWPKLPLLRKPYFALTRGHNRPISVAEVLGRLVSCGFEILEHREIGTLTYFAVRKVREAAVVYAPTYGPMCTLKRIGRGEAPFKVYKLRTMHPYAEFLQDYVYKLNNLDEGGKFRNDFRVPNWGKVLRRLWLDELPMFFNVLKGEMKLVGVRPLSLHYFSLYPPELQELRKRHTPGLLPPFYADLPKAFEEIVESEMRYLKAYEKAPLRTDIRYFCVGVWNILIKRARSA
jgi:lipopolysaccharide/colanic/teichoic acid biosynthesis glycosyltransferase